MSLESAFQTALETFQRTGDAAAGIEAATLALRLGRHAACKSLATQVATVLETANMDRLHHRMLAAGGRAYLLLGDVQKARHWYAQAMSMCGADHQTVAGMRKQARLDLETRRLDRHALDGILTVPRVAAFAGHMVDAPWRTVPRFPSGKVEAVRKAVAERLSVLNVRYGFSSAARGSDILFIEELKKIGGRVKVFLPFPRDHFKKTSVGQGWNERFDAVLKDLQVVELCRSIPDEDRLAETYAACNRAIRQEAITQATSLDEAPLLIAVYNGNPGDGSGGTADAVREWRSQGYPMEIIDLSIIVASP